MLAKQAHGGRGTRSSLLPQAVLSSPLPTGAHGLPHSVAEAELYDQNAIRMGSMLGYCLLNRILLFRNLIIHQLANFSGTYF